ncbi:DUF1294 domain-containing protein [Pseudomonas sp. RP23018S]|uniref:DUF1294 domain-containing protein n=1 Tax=Pseudomonas sp. RP23018S TaxID=3096037 RepID=UPI002ACB0520|nr:DUF1294 domain-containing protein [Pseudomonas sp. RP23018S]MDZ5605429.1 DUF1294 domain-containing protein [Pseudomonas sp. RP23018S]
MAARQHVQYLPLKLALLAALCVMPGLGAVHIAASGAGWAKWALLVYPVASLLSVLLYWRDKHQARVNGQRIPENALHLSELCGGWPGALVAQQRLRHKTRKVSYQVVFWVIVALHQALWAVPFWARVH